MTKIDNNTRIQTLKRMLSVAKKLVENESNEIFELAHHIADNVLSKICMLVGQEQNRDDLVYENGQWRRTKAFNVLYEGILEKFFPNVPKYDEIIKNYDRERNTYHHDLISLDFSIRKPSAINYIKCVEDIMQKVGYLGENKAIEPYTFNTLIQDRDVPQKKQIAQKFKKLYNRLASRDPKHVIIDVRTLLDDIGKIDLGRVLKMDYIPDSKERMMLIEHSKWNLSIKTGSSQHLRLIKYVNGDSQAYDFEIPNQNEDILNEFLDLIRDRCKEHGIF